MHDSKSSPLATPEQPDWALLAAYFAGELGADEADRVRAWLQAHPEAGRVSKAVDEFGAQFAKARASEFDRNVDTAAALAQIKSRMRAGELGRRAAPSRWPQAAWASRLVQMAAAFAIVATGIWGWRARWRDGAEVSFATAVGEQRTLLLSDSTVVHMAPNSRLRVEPGYGREVRRVVLAGTATFEVRHDERAPFSVAVGPAEVRDIGTRFSVQEVGGAVRVAVMEGAASFSVADARDSLVLRAGDAAELRATRMTRVPLMAVDSSWTRKQLAFENTEVRVAVDVLERWYGMRLTFGDTTKMSQHLTATLSSVNRVDAVQVLALSLGLSATWRGDSVVLQSTSR